MAVISNTHYQECEQAGRYEGSGVVRTTWNVYIEMNADIWDYIILPQALELAFEAF